MLFLIFCCVTLNQSYMRPDLVSVLPKVNKLADLV